MKSVMVEKMGKGPKNREFDREDLVARKKLNKPKRNNKKRA